MSSRWEDTGSSTRSGRETNGAAVDTTCPYCLTDVSAGDEVTECPECASIVHRECWEENGGCTVFGCKLTPVEELKLRVHASEIEQAIPSSQCEESETRPAPPREAPIAPPPFPRGGPPAATVEPEPRLDMPSFGGPGSVFGSRPVRLKVSASAPKPKERISYILLAIFLGAFGAHNFYADRTRRAGAQLTITCVSFLLLSPIVWIWAIVDCFVIERDAAGRRMV